MDPALSPACQIGIKQFGIPSQSFAYEMISERCKSKPYTVLWENKFYAPNFPVIDSVGKVSPLSK